MDKLKIAIVGNSPCILEHKWGEEIDSHDIVIRFNNFHTEGYEEYIGTKTTDICFNPSTKYNDMILSLNKEHRLFFYTEMENKYLNDILCKLYNISLDDVNVIDNLKYYIELRDKLHANNNWQGSSGLVICQMMVDTHPNDIIDVYGITFFKDTIITDNNKYKQEIHHFDGSIIPSGHDHQAEWNYYEMYLKNKINLHI